MIATDYTGRLGNQLFTYAFTRYLLECRKKISERLLANFKRSMNGSLDEGYGDSLQHFNIVAYESTSEDLTLKYGSVIQKAIYLMYMLCTRIPILYRNDVIMEKIDVLVQRFGLFYSGAADAARSVGSLSQQHIFVRGYFADKANFDVIRPILLSELTPKYAPIDRNMALYEAIRSSNSVCVSVRRGDYLSEEYKDNFFVCDEAYFRKAIGIIREKVSNPTLFFFSNDIEWVRQHLNYDDISCYYESGTDPVWETLRLMYSCHHFIISNSTFSWWAQYLGRHDDKIVISPSRWFANDSWHSNLLNDNFIKI